MHLFSHHFLSVFYFFYCHKVIRSSYTTQQNSGMSYKLISQWVSSLCDMWYVTTQKWHNFHVLLLYMFKWSIYVMCSKRQQFITTFGVLHKAMKWSLLQDLAYAIPQMEPEQKDAFTSSKINLGERPHFKVVLLYQDKWLINTKHFRHNTTKCNKQPKVGVFWRSKAFTC